MKSLKNRLDEAFSGVSDIDESTLSEMLIVEVESNLGGKVKSLLSKNFTVVSLRHPTAKIAYITVNLKPTESNGKAIEKVMGDIKHKISMTWVEKTNEAKGDSPSQLDMEYHKLIDSAPSGFYASKEFKGPRDVYQKGHGATQGNSHWDAENGIIEMQKAIEMTKIAITQYKKRINETKGDFAPTDDTVMIKIGGYPWYFKKIDSTHFMRGNNPESIEGNFAIASHIGQHRGEDYYNDMKSWLSRNGITSKELNGKEFKGNG